MAAKAWEHWPVTERSRHKNFISDTKIATLSTYTLVVYYDFWNWPSYKVYIPIKHGNFPSPRLQQPWQLDLTPKLKFGWGEKSCPNRLSRGEFSQGCYPIVNCHSFFSNISALYLKEMFNPQGERNKLPKIGHNGWLHIQHSKVNYSIHPQHLIILVS